jgi:hypothetical protein
MYLEPGEIGQRVLFLCTDSYLANGAKVDESSNLGSGPILCATNGIEGGGAYSVTYTNEINNVESFYQHLRDQGFRESVIHHTQQVFEPVQSQGVLNREG